MLGSTMVDTAKADTAKVDTAKAHRSNYIWGIDHINDWGENAGVASTFTRSVGQKRNSTCGTGGLTGTRLA